MSFRLKNLLLSLVLLIGSSSYGQSQALDYLALGDSYTIGESVSETERWPVILADTLRALGHAVSEPKILATTGWTTAELIEGIDSAKIARSYDLVTLLIGVNNQYRGLDISIFREEYTQLLESAIDFAGGEPAHVFVLSIPDYGVTPFAREKKPTKIAREVERYNRVKETITRERGAHFVDITPISKMAKSDNTLLADDRLHPSGKMYTLWVEKALPVVRSEIRTWNLKGQ
ncbi:MAG: SGNH/GDSL hydrolase family protein [Balneolaceae bacterium]|nr:SGNH/GDSL hydrolase family protein [Balneolaceae bacterium]